MNRFDRRENSRYAQKLIGRSTGFVMIALVDGQVMTFGDVSSLYDKDDVRHRVLCAMYKEQRSIVDGISREHALDVLRKRSPEIVEKAKAARSDALSRFVNGED